MANVEKLSIALTPDMAAELRAAVDAGEYGSVSEVIREALRDWRFRRRIEGMDPEALRQLAEATGATPEPTSLRKKLSRVVCPVTPRRR